MNNSYMLFKIIALSSLLIGALYNTVYADVPASEQRLDAIAKRGEHVMPFSLEKTRHLFKKTDDGGIQQVIAKQANDNEQIALIRRHLATLACFFAKGNFSAPQRIHGDDMPGVAELSLHAAQIRFVYQEIPNGGQIAFITQDFVLIEAIHRYFDAQLRDHAHHARSIDPKR